MLKIEMIETILVSYNQICVFDATLDDPFNDWTHEHVHQGFSWRPGSISFGAKENVETTVTIEVTRSIVLDSAAFRIIAVPFVMEAHGTVVVGSIGDEREIEIPPGSYRLIYQLGGEGAEPWCKLNFVVDSNPQPQIIKADSEITKLDDLLMAASPAV